MRLALPFLFCLSCSGALVPYYLGQGYTREEAVNPPRYVRNDGSPSRLYQNGIYVSSESGTNDLNLPACWVVQSNGAKVGVVDMFTGHGERIVEIVRTVSPRSELSIVAMSRFDAGLIAAGIENLVAAGCKVITVTEGFPTFDTRLSNACVLARARDVVLCCAVADSGPLDYPAASRLSNMLPVNTTGLNGRYWLGSVDDSCIGAFGRIVVANGNYSSGCSYSTAMVAGCLAILRAHRPDLTAAETVVLLRRTADDGGQTRRINLLAALRTEGNRLLDVETE